MGTWTWAFFFAVALFFGKVYIDCQHQLNADNQQFQMRPWFMRTVKRYSIADYR